MEIEASLLDAGYEVVGIAATADEALDLARQLKPHIATMDIRLDGAKDGIDAACELFRQFGIRCLFISAHSTFLARGRADAARPLGWLSKPFTSSQLLDSFETALRAARHE